MALLVLPRSSVSAVCQEVYGVVAYAGVIHEKEQACFLPCTGDRRLIAPNIELPVMGPVPSTTGAYIATGHR